jgi:hypothetical protein
VLGNVLRGPDRGKGIKKPDLLACAESHEKLSDDLKLKSYTWVGKLSPNSATSIGGSAGIGFWINNRIINA